ncbi:GntR family transcriptional regulator [Microtetraspora malaysiensis]|uniref:GntR family transcriptional regulator n=1 Tax=Microtetraspora malaysiensis TaxID=161358 RepID=UPI003D9420ED
MSIDHDGAMPVYRQLAEILRGQIERGELAAGRRVPTESALAHTCGLGRDSVRKAVRILREAGLVESVQGRGTFVTRAVEELPGDAADEV